jgi:hypothetical protein
MQIERTHVPAPAGGLAALGDVELSPLQQRMLDRAASLNGGSRAWQARKLAEARDLLALARIAPRLRIDFIDLETDLRAMLHLQVPVPCLPDADGQLRRADRCVLGLTYPEEALRGPLPGPSFMQVLDPLNVWHGNISAPPVQRCCLGVRVPTAIRAKDLVLMTYGALSMQTVQFDEWDAAGVMNVAAAQWWQLNQSLIPLSTEPFLSPPGSR